MVLHITNRTAFPLNVALADLAPLIHINSLEPGQSWTTETPSVEYSQQYHPTSRFSRWLHWWHSVPQTGRHQMTIEALFDHGHNRYDAFVAQRLCRAKWMQWFSVLPAALALGAMTCAHFMRGWLAPCRMLMNILTFGLLCGSCALYWFAQKERRTCEPDPNAAPQPKPIMTVPVLTESLRPLQAPTAAISSSPLLGQPTRRLAFEWMKGRVVLWDVDRGQEVFAYRS